MNLVLILHALNLNVCAILSFSKLKFRLFQCTSVECKLSNAYHFYSLESRLTDIQIQNYRRDELQNSVQMQMFIEKNSRENLETIPEQVKNRDFKNTNLQSCSNPETTTTSASAAFSPLVHVSTSSAL